MTEPRALTRPKTLVPVVLFDMDDTIFDHSLTCRDALDRIRTEYPEFAGRRLEEVWGEYGRLLGVTHVDVMLGRRASEVVRAERFVRLAEWAGRPISLARADEVSRVYREHYQALRRPVEGAPELVRRLHRDHTIGVVTNNTVAEQTEKIAFLGLESAIDALVTSEEIGAAKPDARIFHRALERTGGRPEGAVMVGDSWGSDIVGARAAGIRPIWFNRFRLPRPEAREVAEIRSFRPARRVEELLAGP